MAGPVTQTDVKYLQPTKLDTGRHPFGQATLSVESFGLTDRGQRAQNEDQFLIAHLEKVLRIHQSSIPQPALQSAPDRGYLFIVADGVGGAVAGEKASALAIDAIEHFMLDTLKWFFQLRGKEEETLLQEFQQALGHADARLFAEVRARPHLEGMGTTVTLGFAQEDRLFVAHAGDSRCYLQRGDLLYRLTHDHSLVEEMVERGALTPAEAEHHPFRHVLTNSLGGHTPGVRTDVHKVNLRPNDSMLLTTDGLVKVLSEAEIKTVLAKEPNPQKAAEQLMALAKERTASDNVTLIVARFTAT